MPAKKKPKLTDDELAALRARIRDAMAEQGPSPKGLAKRIGRKAGTALMTSWSGSRLLGQLLRPKCHKQYEDETRTRQPSAHATLVARGEWVVGRGR
jgi:hypothetical protein